MRNILQTMETFCSSGLGRTAFATVCAHSVSISVGLCQAYSAILIPQLVEKVSVTSEESSWLASLGAVTNPIGAILSGLLADYFGRKRAMQISSFPFLLGWACLGIASNMWWLYVGRLITGIAAGMSTACYAYVAEISPPERRGALQALGPISASFGILLTYTLGYFLNWHVVAFISIGFCSFTFFSINFIPESPAYLCRKGKREESLESLLWFRGDVSVAEQECSRMSSSSCSVPKKVNFKDLYLSPTTIKPFFILVFLFLLQELSGIYTILFYAVSFFQDSSLDIDEYVASIIVGVIRFLMSIVAAVLINKYGRRTLCMLSSAGMGLSMLLAGSYFKYYEINTNETREFVLVPLICVLFNVLFSMIGMLPIPWILVGELFPVEVRSTMSGLVICIAQCFIFICVKVYNDMNYYLNFSGTLFVFFVSSFAALFFCKYVLPETKNKSLEEIESYFVRSRKREVQGVDNRAYAISVGDFDASKRGELGKEVWKVKITQ